MESEHIISSLSPFRIRKANSPLCKQIDSPRPFESLRAGKRTGSLMAFGIIYLNGSVRQWCYRGFFYFVWFALLLRVAPIDIAHNSMDDLAIKE
ncbi:hypothetical protein L195_g049825 [Trifolium pratense]|uniref:Uncharacterized protein n=1 Tax=Trifolium pratense TaxID=57577 RepID=A0A2K3JQL4_TRIPR|nr:hypothetical protein L195_g049825 [Trifolium pratense]